MRKLLLVPTSLVVALAVTLSITGCLGGPDAPRDIPVSPGAFDARLTTNLKGKPKLLVPGMTHSGGGQSTDQFDMLTAIQQWVEKGQAPDRVVASGRAFPGKTRPLCPYPKVARFDGGNADDEKSFSCR